MNGLLSKQREEINKLKQRQAKELKEEWRNNYPNGEYFIMRGPNHSGRRWRRYNDNDPEPIQELDEFRLFWKSDSKQDFCLQYSKKKDNGYYGYNDKVIMDDYGKVILEVKHAYSSWGRYTTKYNSIEKFLIATQKFKIPRIFIEFFIERYNNRFENGYMCQAHAECREDNTPNKDMIKACSEAQKLHKIVL